MRKRIMIAPHRFLDRPGGAAEIIRYFPVRDRNPETSYATVRDYCESLDHLPQITGMDGDLKNVQRPWAVKALLRSVKPPAKILEIGGGEPVVSAVLNELGYDVTVVDPYDGSGNGPTAYQQYVERFPNVKIVRKYLEPQMPDFAPASFAAIFSVSVLEHLPVDAATRCFQAIREFLAPGGASVHCFDFILQGNGQEYDRTVAQNLLALQSTLGNCGIPPALEELLERLRADTETFFLSPQGHHLWRGELPYEKFPFRRVVSIQSIAFLPANNAN